MSEPRLRTPAAKRFFDSWTTVAPDQTEAVAKAAEDFREGLLNDLAAIERDSARYVLRIVGEPANCRSCGVDVFWVVTARGKRMPMDPGGTSHFATCPHAESWRGAR